MGAKVRKHRFNIGRKMYIFVIITVLMAAIGITVLAYFINVNQIDTYFKNLAKHSAENFATMVDPNFLDKLRKVAKSEEYQKMRDEAEENEDEAAVEAYLKKEGLWEQYCETREKLCKYLHSMKDLKYLYIIEWGDKDADHDMYLIDDDDNPITETGYYEEREEEFAGADPTQPIEPTISNGDWGWLCSAYAPVYLDDGTLVCHIGCDVGMDDIMAERRQNLNYMILSAVGITVIVLIGAVILANKTVVKPLDRITAEMNKFKPGENTGYDEAGVIKLDIHSRDEIQDIYEGVRSMQINIIDYLNDLANMQKDKERAENEARDKEAMIGKISEEAYKDPLTKVGNKAAYLKMTEELKQGIENGKKQFAIVMIDINNLKHINDDHGHNAGDAYINGCCHIICEIYKHSPVFRIGGDEFVTVLRGEDYEHRQESFARLKQTFEQTYNQQDAQPWERYSAAAGMAEYAFDDNSVEFVFKRADKAMYADKTAFKEKYGKYR